MSVHLHSNQRSISEDSNINRHNYETLESCSDAIELQNISLEQLGTIYCKPASFLPPTRTVNISTLGIFLDPHHQL